MDTATENMATEAVFRCCRSVISLFHGAAEYLPAKEHDQHEQEQIASAGNPTIGILHYEWIPQAKDCPQDYQQPEYVS